jgi:S1-C subfamily serine protease
MKKLIMLLSILVMHSAQSKGYPVRVLLEDNTYIAMSDFGRGTAFAVTYDNQKYLVTNWHVCYYAQTIKVHNERNKVTFTANILKADFKTDLCVLKVNLTVPSSFLKLSKKFNKHGILYTLGYPGGYHKRFAQGHYIQTVKLALPYETYGRGCPRDDYRMMNNKCLIPHILQDTTMLGGAGTSGSAVVNSKGEVVGVVNSNNGNKATMLRLEELRSVLSSL